MRKLKFFSMICFFSLFMATIGCQELVDDYVGKKPVNAKTIDITMIAKSSTNPVFISAHEGAEAAAKELSEKHSMIEVNISWRTPMNEDAREQAERIRNAIKDGTDAIIVSCSDEDTLTAAINDAVDRDIPVMTFDSDAPNSKRFAFYGPNDVEIGENVMNELATLIGEKGQVAILGGNQNAPNLQKRVKGVQRAAVNYPGIEIVGVFYHNETAVEAADTVLQVNRAYPQLKGWAMVGGWPFFNEILLDKIEPGQIKIVAVDALPVQLPFLEKGIVQVLLGQPTFKWGKVSVESIIDKIYLDKDVPVFNQMKLIRVTKANLGGWARQLRAWGYEDIPPKYLTM